VDVVFGEQLFDEPEVVTAEDVLDFAGIAPPKLRLYPIESHLAEKLHAYTMPRPHPNSRVKDLPDIALLATIKTLEAVRLRDAIRQTFAYRGSHPIPEALPDPAQNWIPLYAAMALENELAWPTLEAVTAAARAFLDPILQGGADLLWHPESWQWRPR
jgi:hypothetical protein